MKLDESLLAGLKTEIKNLFYAISMLKEVALKSNNSTLIEKADSYLNMALKQDDLLTSLTEIEHTEDEIKNTLMEIATISSFIRKDIEFTLLPVENDYLN